MIRSALIFLLSAASLAVPSSYALAETCLKSYLTNEKWVAHPFKRKDLETAIAAAQQHGVDRGWKAISRFGDNYAGLASLVTRKSSGVMARMVHRHWQTVVGAELELKYFDKVAAQHFKQYVEILGTGTWPDSNQILLSYLTAVRSFGLPDELVFDASWQSSHYHFILDWRAFNILPLERWADTDRVCLHIDEKTADQIIEKDFGG